MIAVAVHQTSALSDRELGGRRMGVLPSRGVPYDTQLLVSPDNANSTRDVKEL